MKVIRKKYPEPTWNDNTYIVTITAKLRLTKKHCPKTKWRIKELLESELRLARLPKRKRPWTEKTKFIYARKTKNQCMRKRLAESLIDANDCERKNNERKYVIWETEAN